MATIGVPQINVRMGLNSDPYGVYVRNEVVTVVDFTDPLTGMGMRITEDEWNGLGNPPVIVVNVYAG